MAIRCKKLGIANYRSFGPGSADVAGALPGDAALQYVDIDNDIIVLIGANNSGKSTILHAYDTVRQQKRKLDLDDFFRRDQSAPVVLEVWLAADEISDAAEKTRKWYNPGEGNVAIVRKIWSAAHEEAQKITFDWERGEWIDGGFGGWDSILQSELPEPIWLKAIMSEEEILGTVRDLVKEVVLAKVKGTEEFAKAESAVQALSSVVESDEFLSAFGDAATESLARTFTDATVSISNQAASRGVISLFDKQAQIEIELSNSPKMPFGRHGHGLQRQCALSLLGVIATESAKIEREKKKKHVPSEPARILLIEEPELFLSPTAVRIVRDNLYLLAATERFQVMAATHSPLMVDLARPKQTVARVWKHAALGSRTYQIDAADTELKDLLALDDSRPINAYYSEAFFSDEVIICEGEAEAIALSEIFDRLPTPIDQSRYFLLVAGGNYSVPVYQRLCMRFGIPHFILYDLERKTNDKGESTNAWSVHERVIEQRKLSAERGVLSRVFVQVRNFETAHGLHDGGDKRRKAREFARCLDVSATGIPLLNFCALLQGQGVWPELSLADLDALDAAAP